MNLETHLDHLTRQDEYLNRGKSGCIVDGSQLVVISLLFILGNIFPACAASVLVISDSI
jgi:hypothetical protein